MSTSDSGIEPPPTGGGIELDSEELIISKPMITSLKDKSRCGHGLMFERKKASKSSKAINVIEAP